MSKKVILPNMETKEDLNVHDGSIAATEGHPKGLYLLFLVEMWERFSYYGMRALLVLFMTKHFFWNTQQSGQIYGMYTSLVYLTPLLGGYIADRYWGARKAIIVGGILMALGHFAMVPETVTFFYIALGLLILGNGFFKPNISIIVGNLYKDKDPRRDGGFTIFYMGINLGAFFSPLICGYLGEKVGWGYGFGAAGVGMVIGLLLFIWGQNKYLGDLGKEAPYKEHAAKSNGEKTFLTKVEKQRIAVIFVMAFFTVFFWAAFEQAGSSMTLFADRSTDRMLFNWEIPASYFQSLNPAFIVLLAPFFSMLWIWLAKKGKEPSTPLKFVIGLVLLAFGFVVMALGAKEYAMTGKVNLLYLVFAYLLHTLGELALSPVGLSLVTKLSPVKFASLFMGVWFLAISTANYVAGFFAGNYDNMDHVKFFMTPVYIAGASALVLFVLIKPIRKLMHGIH